MMGRIPARSSRLSRRRRDAATVPLEDLYNLLESTDVATLCLDPRLRIKWFTPAAGELLRLRPADVGRPVADLDKPPLADATLAEDAGAVLKRRVPLEVEGRDNGRFVLRRTLPYRTRRGDLKGVIVNFYDLTVARRATTGALAAHRRARRALGEQVNAGVVQVNRLAAELTAAEERERETIARDLHDNLSQLLHVIRLKLARLARALRPEDASMLLRELDELTRKAEGAARSLVFQLVPPVLGELGLVPALQWLGEDLQRTHDLAVEIREDGADKPLGQSTRTVVYRAVRELLINVAKHARTDHARVDVRVQGGRLQVSVFDRGKGFDAARVLAAPHKGLGLASLRERVHFLGGSAEIRSVPGDGTKAVLKVPLGEAPP